MDLTNQKILVVGFGVTGAPLVQFLHEKGAEIILNDSRKAESLAHLLKPIENLPIKTIFGSHPTDLSTYGNPDLVVLSPGVPLDLPFIELLKQQKVKIIGEVELAYQYMKAPIAAITGTNGKTTTTALTGEIFRLGGKSPQVVGNIGVPAISKAELLNSDQYFVMEISSFQLETIETFRPKAAALLNITPDHLNRHGTMDAYTALKYRIFENQQKDDVAVINADDPVCMAYEASFESSRLYFSRKKILKEGVFLMDDHMVYHWKNEQLSVINYKKIRMPGLHNLENAMAATGLALSQGISVEAVREALETFKGVEHRIEFVGSINDVNFVNDSKATNPDAAIKAIEAVAAPIILIAGGMDKKNDFTAFFEAFNQKVRQLFIYGETAPILAETAAKMSFDSVQTVSDLEEAVNQAARIAKSGDTVLLSPACASWDMYTSYEARGDHFKSLVAKLK